MFVIPDQRARRIGRKRGLAGAREAEEDSGIDRVARRMVGRAMHRHHALGRQQVVEQREHRLLDLARIGGLADQDHLLVEMHRDHGFRAAPVARRVGLERRRVDDRPFRDEGIKLVARRTAQHVADEQVVPGKFGDNPHVDPVCGISSGVEVLHEQVAPGQMRDHVGLQPVERLGRHRAVVFPPDRPFDRRGAHDELVLRRPAGKLPRRAQERPPQPDLPLAARYCGGHEGRFDQVVMGIGKACDPLILKTVGRVDTSVVHLKLLSPFVRRLDWSRRAFTNVARWPPRTGADARAITRRFAKRTEGDRSVSATIGSLSHRCVNNPAGLAGKCVILVIALEIPCISVRGPVADSQFGVDSKG